ncbi:peptide deformylase [Brachybacterium sp. EF45031]|uniref:peptide deformylase n=1 Tax=Brachybacterium sillae TaxID=2810536 RepID=UPI00217E48A4|nr:peptide deformylase [Brachybacterium sillae]MCS6712589.1 peptide deformylase [Brachybacterium sillae]
MDLLDLTTRVLARRESPTDPLRIVQAGHPALRVRSRDWDGQLPAAVLTELVEAMTLTMRHAPGVGLAAPQVGIPLRLVVMEDRVQPGEESEHDPLERRGMPLRCVLNPEYEVLGDERVYFWEGCLSVDGWMSLVPRGRRVRMRAQELRADGTIIPAEEELTGWSARIVQHETDHLAGTLCHDRSVPRSLVRDHYTSRYADLTEAVRFLGLEGDVTRLDPGEVVLRP